MRESAHVRLETSTAEPVIPLSVPALRGNEWKYLKECLDTGWVSSAGPFIEQFERKVAESVGVLPQNAVATVNGTAALHLALKVAGVREGDEVLVPTLTFIAPVNAVRYCGAHPLFVDADPATWQMDVDQVERFLERECTVQRAKDSSAEECRRRGRRVRAILPVHILGLACDMKRIMELAKTYHLQVIEDAAEGMGVRVHGQHVGWWGHMGVLSFNGNKIMTAGGGGMVVAHNKPDYVEYARYLSTQAKDSGIEHVHGEVGYNYRLTNLQAAVGLAQLEQLPEFLKKKRAIARRYREAFADVPEITSMPEQDGASYWLYTMLVPNRVTRDALLARLAEEQIEARPLWRPIHTLPPYKTCDSIDPHQAAPNQVAMGLYERGVSLPSSVGLSDAALTRCLNAVRRLVRPSRVLAGKD